MAKTELRIKARELRSKGESVKQIAKLIGVSKSTVSLWVRDIILSVEQLEFLLKRRIKAGELGRLKGALMQKERRLNLTEEYKKKGLETIKNLSDREFLIAGIALYWAEGTKKKREVSVCNSDPKMINFMISWLKKFHAVQNTDLVAVVGINQIHKEREILVKDYWSKISGIPLDQFRKTSFKITNNKKVYANFNEHFGTLTVKVLKSTRLYYKILGLIDGLSMAG